jgi:hypothetical protein
LGVAVDHEHEDVRVPLPDTAPPDRDNLPFQLTGFIGREAERAYFDQLEFLRQLGLIHDA